MWSVVYIIHDMAMQSAVASSRLDGPGGDRCAHAAVRSSSVPHMGPQKEKLPAIPYKMLDPRALACCDVARYFCWQP